METWGWARGLGHAVQFPDSSSDPAIFGGWYPAGQTFERDMILPWLFSLFHVFIDTYFAFD
jgi:hypothetical protein